MVNYRLKAVWRFKDSLIVILTPLLFLPLPLVIPTSEAKCGYGMIIMAVYWVTEVLPLGVTALMPVFLFPLMGVAGAKPLSQMYLKDTNMLFVGGLMLAVAIEQWNLHKRIALRVLMLVGSEPRWLMMGFMLITAFLSMWVSNTATTSMMIPIAQAVIMQMMRQKKKTSLSNAHGKDIEVNENGIEMVEEKKEKGEIPAASEDTVNFDNLTHEELQICKLITLCVAYAASIGGVATLTGTGPNLVIKGLVDEMFHGEAGLSFSSWFIFSFPVAVICLVIAWIWLQIHFLGFRALVSCKKRDDEKERSDAASEYIRKEYRKLGPMSFGEIAVALHFAALALLWITREPEFIPGWSSLFVDGYVTDAVPSIFICVSLFVFPSRRPNFLCFGRKGRSVDGYTLTGDARSSPAPALLQWKTASKKFPWGIVLLLGGGFALAEATKLSGLSQWMGDQLTVLQGIPTWALCLVVVILIGAATELTSNVAIASIFLPILANLALSLKIHPLYILIPTTIATSFSFMLPVATPPNAIAFSYGLLKATDMAKAGFMLNIICIIIVNIAINTWGSALFQLDTFPSWAANMTSATMAPV